MLKPRCFCCCFPSYYCTVKYDGHRCLPFSFYHHLQQPGSIRWYQYAPYLADEGTETLGSKRPRWAWALKSSLRLTADSWDAGSVSPLHLPVPVSSWTIYWSPCLAFLPSHSPHRPPTPHSSAVLPGLEVPDQTNFRTYPFVIYLATFIHLSPSKE